MKKRAVVLVLLMMATMVRSVFCAEDIAREAHDAKAVPTPIATGISFNQQIASSSLNSATTAVANGGQFVITKSGRYFLSTDIVANPVASAPIIYINSSDVILDLGGKTLTITATTNLMGCVGIKVAAGMNNVAICNGTVSGTSAASPTNRLNTGISFAGASNNLCTNITLDTLDVTGCGTYGLQFTYCNNVIMSNVRVQKTTNTDTAAASKYALAMSNCTDCNIVDSSFNYTEITYASAAVTAYGISLTSCSDIQFKNVSASNNRGSAAVTAAAAVGIYLNATNNCTFDTVRAVANQITGGGATQTATTSPIAGFWIDGTTASSQNNIFIDCEASNNTALSASRTCSAYGFRLTVSSGQNSFLRCRAASNSGVSGEGFSSSNCNANIYAECSASGNGGAAANNYVTAAGFRSEYGSGNSFVRCNGSNNNTGSAATASTLHTAHGIILRSETFALISNSLFAANGYSTAKGAAHGIRLAGSCTSCLIENNKMMSNQGVAQYGFKDDSANATSMLRGNIAFNQGACTPGAGSLANTTTTNYYLVFVNAIVSQNMIKEVTVANMAAVESASSSGIWYNFSVIGA